MEADEEQDKKPIRVVLADDHAVVRQGIRRVLEADEGFEVVAEAADLESRPSAGSGQVRRKPVRSSRVRWERAWSSWPPTGTPI